MLDININEAIPATARKLKSGEWGAQVKTHAVEEGDLIRINTKAGDHFYKRVEKVKWRKEFDGEEVSLLEVSNLSKDELAEVRTQDGELEVRKETPKDDSVGNIFPE